VQLSVRFTRPTVKLLIQHLKAAYDAGALRSVRRISALLGLAQGESVIKVAQTFSVSRQAVYGWLKDYLLRGVESVIYCRPTGRKPKLTKTQKRRLVELVKAGPLAAGYLSHCWTSLLIQQLILREFGVLYDRHYVCELLHNLGFSYQKAKFVSDHLDEEGRGKWLTETWPQILQQAVDQEAMILFQDEVGFAQWGSLSYTWALVGQQPVVKTCGKRKAYKVFGAIDFFSGRFYYQGLTEGRFNSERYQEFLRQILNQTPKHVFLIQDGARYHTSKATRAFFEAHANRLTVFQLPSYSPDYNPIEFLWKNVKRRSTHNQYFPEYESLVASVDEGLAHFAGQRQAIKNLMGRYVDTLAALPAAA
jgi:transposase